MNALQTRYAELQSNGRAPVYCYKNATVELDRADNVQIVLGLQPNGRYLNLADLDSHKPGQDAVAARAALVAALPHLASKIEWHPTPRGLHGLFETYKPLPTGRLYDSQGNHIGELLSDGRHTRDHGDIQPPTLTLTEIEHLFLHWSVDCGEPGGEQWKERAKEGAKLTAGYKRTRVTKAELRAFLVKECGNVGKQLDALFDERGIFDRSAAAGNLMQTLMYHARRMPGAESYRTVMAYWMTAESYGKADDRDYNQEKDGCSLIAQIVHGDMKKNGKPWIAPFWVKGKTKIDIINVCSEPEPAPAPPRPAHRPVGDRAKQIKRLRRLLERRALDYAARIPYYIDDLADELGVSHRSVQNYLHALEKDKLITRGQDQTGPGGRAWLVLLPAFWGANNSEKATETVQESAPIWGANEIAPERIGTPQNEDRQPVCIKEEDHQNTCAPAIAEPAGASYVPALDWTARPSAPRRRVWAFDDAPDSRPSQVAALLAVPLENMQLRPEPAPQADQGRFDGVPVPVARGGPSQPPPRHVRRQARQKGQRTIEAELREPMAERQARERDARIERLAASVARAEAAGQQPTKRAERLAELRAQSGKMHRSDPLVPAPYRPRAPLGAQPSVGVPLPAPAGAAWAGTAEREAAHVE